MIRAHLASLLAMLSVAMTALPAAPAFAARPATVDVSRVAQCSWDRPGVDPFMGDVVAAVDHYADIPADVRTRLKERMTRRDYDDIAVIRRDSIAGREGYDPTIREMHFGTSRMCTNVTRNTWSRTQEERGLVYCEGDQCLIVPTVCRNVSRINRLPKQAVAAAPVEAPPAADGELVFAPPGAGAGEAPADAPPEGGGMPTEAPLTFAEGAGSGPSGTPWMIGGYATGSGFGGVGGSGGIGVLPPGPIAAVIEPSTWALMFAGLLLIGWRARRSRPHREARASCT